jgi:hypothetical protein
MNQETSNPPAGFGVFSKIETMTADEQKLVNDGICPRCLPPEGRPAKMKLLGDFGDVRGYQCRRCTTVWIAKPAPVQTFRT